MNECLLVATVTITSLSLNKSLVGGGSSVYVVTGGPKGIRTPVSGLRGQRPRPLDDGTRYERIIDCNLNNCKRSYELAIDDSSGYLAYYIRSLAARHSLAFGGNSGEKKQSILEVDRDSFATHCELPDSLCTGKQHPELF